MANKPGRVLALTPPWRGHAVQLLSLADELASRGLDVDVCAAPEVEAWLQDPAYRFTPWTPSSRLTDSLCHQPWTAVSHEASIWKGQKRLVKMLVDLYEPLFESLRPVFRKVKPHIAIMDWTMMPAMDAATLEGVPSILLSRFLGDFVPAAPGHPRFGLPYSSRMSLRQRWLNRLLPLYQIPRFLPLTLKLAAIRKSHGLEGDPSKAFSGRTLIVGAADVLEFPRKLPDTVHLVGPIFPTRDPRLQSDLELWLNGRSRTGVVFLSFGTLATPDSVQIKALIAGLKELGLGVLWYAPPKHTLLPSDLPGDFRVEREIPQIAVLSHPAVRLFVNHCGRNSANEALLCGVPVMAIPFFGDQHYNAARLLDAGVARILDKNDLTPELITAKARELLGSEEIHAAAERQARSVSRSRGRELAGDIVERQLSG